MRKEALRKEILARRRAAFSPSLSAEICERAAALEAFRNASSVMVYFGTGSEVDTSRLLALCHRSGKKIAAPRVLNAKDMEAAWLGPGGFVRGSFGIWEPTGDVAADVDLIFVPGVVFDKNKNRIGYGKGYYDRFLEGQHAVTVGLAFSCQLVPEIPADPHDRQLDMILTEEGVYL